MPITEQGWFSSKDIMLIVKTGNSQLIRECYFHPSLVSVKRTKTEFCVAEVTELISINVVLGVTQLKKELKKYVANHKNIQIICYHDASFSKLSDNCFVNCINNTYYQ